RAGGERELEAVGRPGRALVVRVVVRLDAGELAQAGAVAADHVDVHVAVDVGLEGDLAPVRRPVAGRVVDARGGLRPVEQHAPGRGERRVGELDRAVLT